MIADSNITKILKIHPMYLTSKVDIITALDESEDGDFATEWAGQIFDVIRTFDIAFPVQVRRSKGPTRTGKKKRTK